MQCSLRVGGGNNHSHTAGEWTQTTTTHSRKCTECGDEMDSGEHVYDDDCDETCNTCGYHRSDAHTYDNACDTQCNVCGATREITHSYGEYHIDFVNHKHYRTCSVCNDIETDDHHYQSGVCLECGDAENVTYTYTDNAYTLTNAKNTIASSIVIPETYNDGTHGDYPVTAIAEKAFYGCTNLESVTIPASVTTIGSEAFNYCIKLSRANYTGTISQWAQINFATYSSTPALYSKSLYIDGENVTEVAITGADIKAISNYAFFDFEYITKVIVPNSVETIGALAFGNCSSLKEVELGSGITNIYGNAFNKCVKIEKVNYMGTVGQWAKIVFAINTSNPITYAKSLHINGNLLTEINDVSTNHISEISKYAFYNCGKLTKVITGTALTTINEDAFYGCADLKEVIINENVSTIKGNVFKHCPSLESIRVNGNTHYSSKLNGTQLNCISNGGTIITGCKNTKLDNTTLKIIGDESFVGSGITTLVVPQNISSIGEYAFENCTALTSVSIPKSCTIGDYAFTDCTALESVTTSSGTIGKQAFSDCTSLSNVTIGDKITQIDNYAFMGCKSLKTITIPASVTSIGENAFLNCYLLAEVYDLRSNSTLKAGDQDSGYLAYYALYVYHSADETSKITTDENGYKIYTNDDEKILVEYTGTATNLVLPEGITKIKQQAFYNCTSITSITIPASVTKIESRAFEGCDSLESLIVDSNNETYYSENNCIIRTYNTELVAGCKSSVIPTDVTQIGQYAFYNCHNLQSVTIPDSVEYIFSYAFGYCTGLTNVTVGSGIKIMHIGAFVECTNLSYVNYTGTIDSWAEIDFKTGTGIPNSSNPASFAGALHINNELVTTVNLTTATKISAYAFNEFKNITSVTMGDSVKSVGESAFYGCEQLTSVIFSNCSQTTIHSYTFSNCYNLKTLVIPASIKTVKSYAFFNCANLKNVYSLGTVGYNTITVENYSWANDNIFFKNATIYSYSSVQPSQGNYWHFAEDGVTPVIWDNAESQES